jgi:hypothetical protein
MLKLIIKNFKRIFEIRFDENQSGLNHPQILKTSQIRLGRIWQSI